MKVSQALAIIKASSLQNVSNDWADDSVFIELLNGALAYIFCYLLNKGSWYYALHEEDILPNGSSADKRFTTTYPIAKIIELKDQTGSTIYEAPMSFNISTTRAGADEDSQGFMRSPTSTNEITTIDGNSTINVIYNRFPKTHTLENKSSEDIDIPVQLIFAVTTICNWMLMPIHLEQGATLSNNYLSQARNFLDEYATTVHVNQTGFTS